MSIYIPYTYLVGWSNLGEYYYGVRYAKGCHPNDLWSKYFTSSQNVKNYREQYGEPDIIQIRRTFTNANDAIAWEAKVLQRMKLHLHENFLNLCVYPAVSPEVMKKRTSWNKGKTGLYTASEETKRKIGEAHKGKPKPATSKALKGNKNTSGWKWYHNGEKSILIRPNEQPPLGYIKGRLDTLHGKTKGKTYSEETKRRMSEAAIARSKQRLCCITCQKELPVNSLASHNRFCF